MLILVLIFWLMKNFETPLAITMGDPSGIGPDYFEIYY